MSQRRYPPGTLGAIVSGQQYDALDIFDRWNLQRDSAPARRVAADLAEAWRSWSAEHKELLLRTMQQIARAEVAKKNWEPKRVEPNYRALALAGVQAARMVTTLGETFPQPWDESHLAVQKLAAGLMGFAAAALDESSIADHDLAIEIARDMAAELMEAMPHHAGRVSWALQAQLVSLASGGEIDARDDSFVKRYSSPGHEPNRSTPAAPTWRRTWNDMKEAAKVASGIPQELRNREDFILPARLALGKNAE